MLKIKLRINCPVCFKRVDWIDNIIIEHQVPKKSGTGICVVSNFYEPAPKILTDDQIKAIKSLERALIKAGEVNLEGGVFDLKFCIWPRDRGDDVHRSTETFFEVIDLCGATLAVGKINLDGGAGV